MRAMSTIPWTIQRTKRRTPATEPRSRERRRLSDDVNAEARKRQSTLTQIQFVQTPSRSSEENESFQEISLAHIRGSRSASNNVRRSGSTLTQMEWLHPTTPGVQQSSDNMLSMPERDGDWKLQPTLPQSDGTHDHLSYGKRRVSPTTRRMVIPDSDDEDNKDELDLFRLEKGSQKKTRATKNSQSFRENATVRRARSRENQDMYLYGNAGLDIEERKAKAPEYPQTPRKLKIEEIPSSQTPQSEARTDRRTRFHDLNVSNNSAMRHPLKERSVNIQPKHVYDARALKKLGRSPRKSPGKKVCVLKRPTNNIYENPLQIEDSQDDFSPVKPALSPMHRQGHQPCPVPTYTGRSSSADDVLEIPASSQYDHASEASDSVPKAESVSSSGSKELGSPLAVPKGEDTGDGEADSDLGSPVANDTQFNQALLQRTSSPFSSEPEAVSQTRDGTRTLPSSLVETKSSEEQHDLIYRACHSDYEDPQLLDDTMPTPRLIKSRALISSTKGTDDEVTTHDSVLHDQDHRHSSQAVKQVATNNSGSSPTSSAPMLPTDWFTQKSAHPAALPRPSQISTQDPTQGFALSSIAHMLSEDVVDDDDDDAQGEHIETVTIKDSSSISNELNQIPEHSNKDHCQALGLSPPENSEDEIDDLDLDPDSPSKNSARKSLYRRDKSQLKQRNATTGQIQNLSSALLGKRQRSSSPDLAHIPVYDDTTPRNRKRTRAEELSSLQALLDTISSSPSPPPVNTDYIRKQIPGFDNETQSNFTQHGHISAAYIHRQREAGVLPESYIPPRLQIPDSDEEEGSEL